MPKYIFNIHHDQTNLDQEVAELVDIHAGWAMATRTAGEIL